MLNTVTGPDRLTSWEASRNNVSIMGNANDDTYLYNKVKGLFRSVADQAKALPNKYICAIWTEECQKLEDSIFTDLRTKYSGTRLPSDIHRIARKVIGNVGEIFAEKFFQLYGGKYSLDPMTYRPVSPFEDHGVDATASYVYNPKCQYQIQVKNYLTYAEDTKKSFLEAFRALGNMYAKYFKSITDTETLLTYKDGTFCILFTFMDISDTRLIDDNRNITMVIGPKEINKALAGHTAEFAESIYKEI